MVESGKEYVLQWSGHAAHITERFSGLLARQALVDVTLICQGQKLRVHKLVLASSSLYFEEMLEQDLGQEPIILLRDLDFEVLKAMVEFMYCGETTISQCHLQTLVDAAQVFKVRELKCIVESMMKSEITNEKVSADLKASLSIGDALDVKKNNDKARPSGERCDEKSLPSDLEQDEIAESKGDHTLDNNSRMNYIDEEGSLYETPESMEEEQCCQNEEESSDGVSLDTSDSERSKVSTSSDNENEETPGHRKIVSSTDENVPEEICNEHRCTSVDETNLRKNVSDEASSNNTRSNFQDLPRAVGECSRVYTHKKRKFTDSEDFTEDEPRQTVKISNTDESFFKDSLELDDTAKKLDKSLKVYTHKRRGSTDTKKSLILDNTCDSMEEPTSTSSIDLSDDASSSETPPIDISTSLDMETSEYIWSLSTESIQYVVGCTINSSNSLINNSETTRNKNNSRENISPDDNRENVTTSNNQKKSTRQMKELYSCDRGNREIGETPVLRRSVRINQLESDDSLNNNATVGVVKVREKSSDRERDDFASNNGSTMNLAKTSSRRRVNRDADFRTTDENIVTTSNSQRKSGNSRPLRSRTKLSPRKSDTLRCRSSTRGDEGAKGYRHDREKTEKIDSPGIPLNTRLNTIASVDRALWGDMSDVMENRDDYTSDKPLSNSGSREIPFAVGLLPLRAALERMQATLDHQPRKTRSSVAPFRQDVNPCHGRKLASYDDDADEATGTRKLVNSENDPAETALCHIEIRTSSRCNGTDGRRISTDEQIVAVGSTSEGNEQ